MTFEPYWVSLFVTPILIRWLGIYAETARAKRKNGVIAFPASGASLLCFISMVLAISIVIGGWHQRAGPVTVGIGIVWGLWPTTIVLDDLDSQRSIFGDPLGRLLIQRLNMSLEWPTEAQSFMGVARYVR